MSEAASPISLSASAARRIAVLIAQDENAGMKFRVSVSGGGCSGFQYKFDLVPHAEPGDIVLERSGAKIVIDSVSLGFLAGSEIDFVDDLIGASFRIHNPKATQSCGCGTSFSL